MNFFHHSVKKLINANLVGLDSTSGKAIFFYSNTDKNVTSTGAEFSSMLTLPMGIDVNLSAFALSPKSEEGEFLAFINRLGANFSITHSNNKLNLDATISGEVNGPMKIQAISPDSVVRENDSPSYATTNLLVEKRFGHVAIFAGCNNLFDFYQKPFSDSEGTVEYYWGPIVGRELFAGLKILF